MNEENISRIQQLICSTLLIEHVEPHQDLFEAGYLDSLSIVSLMVALEEEFQINIEMETLDLQDFQSVQSIHKLIAPKLKKTA